jgi:hypothetical protein
MPLQRWVNYTEDNVSREKDRYGIYELGDSSGMILYIGEGIICSQLLSHLPTGSKPFPRAERYRVEYASDKSQAVERLNRRFGEYLRLRDGEYPVYNRKRRDQSP